MRGKQLLSMKCVPYVQHMLNYFHCFCTSTMKIVPVQTILYQFKLFCASSNYFVPLQSILYQFNLFCTSSKTNCSKVKIELQHILEGFFLPCFLGWCLCEGFFHVCIDRNIIILPYKPDGIICVQKFKC